MHDAAIIRRSLLNIGKVLLMKDSTRESLSYFGLYAKMLRVKKEIEKAQARGIPYELYSVVDKRDTHSWYTAGMFLGDESGIG